RHARWVLGHDAVPVGFALHLTRNAPALKHRREPGRQPGDDAAMPAKPRVITIEEHYQDPDVLAAYAPEDARQLPALAERLNDLTGLRIKEMDEVGIDMQVLSHANPGLQKLDAATAVRLARIANDRLAET